MTSVLACLWKGRRMTEPSTTTQETRELEQIEEFPIPAGGWVCFHCNEVFTTREKAAEHFGNGDYEDETPLCIVAATTEQEQLILTNREMWDELQKARHENEDLEDRLSGFEYTARKITKKPHATTHDLEHEWDFMEGRVIAAESRAPFDTEQRLRQEVEFAVANGHKWDLNDWANWINNHARAALQPKAE